MPATGVFAPERTLVAVLAIAPVAGMPPKSGVTMLAMPCATSSMFDRWRLPIMPSDTTAESKDSTAPSIAMVKAGPTNPVTCVTERCGITGCGIARDAALRGLSDRSSGRWNKRAIAVPRINATNAPELPLHRQPKENHRDGEADIPIA